MDKIIYRIYANNINKGWELLGKENDFEEAKKMKNDLRKEEYESFLIIEHNIKHNSDFPIYEEAFSNVKKFKNKYKVDTKPKIKSKMVEKIEKYIENER